MACFIVAALLPHFYLRAWTQGIIGTLCVIAAYSNMLSKMICAVYNVRGYAPAGSYANIAAFALNLLALVTTVLDLFMLMGLAIFAVGHKTVEHESLSGTEINWSGSEETHSFDGGDAAEALPATPTQTSTPTHGRKDKKSSILGQEGVTKRKQGSKKSNDDSNGGGGKRKSFYV